MIARNLAVHVSPTLRHKTHVQFVPWYNNYEICAKEHAHILFQVPASELHQDHHGNNKKLQEEPEGWNDSCLMVTMHVHLLRAAVSKWICTLSG